MPTSGGDLALRNPITGIAGFCARAVSGHAVAAPPRLNMNSCRRMWIAMRPSHGVRARTTGHYQTLIARSVTAARVEACQHPRRIQRNVLMTAWGQQRQINDIRAMSVQPLRTHRCVAANAPGIDKDDFSYDKVQRQVLDLRRGRIDVVEIWVEKDATCPV